MTLPADVRQYPDAIAQALSQLRLVGVNGPYSVVLGADAYTALSETVDNGYPVLEHVKKLVKDEIIWAPGHRRRLRAHHARRRFRPAHRAGRLDRFSDLAFVQDDPTDELNIEMNHVPDDLLIADQDRFATQPPRRILYQSKCLRKNRVQTASEFIGIVDVGKILFPLRCLLAKLIFRERLKLLFQLIDLFDERANSFDLPLVL